jgi:hypothetical protein
MKKMLNRKLLYSGMLAVGVLGVTQVANADAVDARNIVDYTQDGTSITITGLKEGVTLPAHTDLLFFTEMTDDSGQEVYLTNFSDQAFDYKSEVNAGKQAELAKIESVKVVDTGHIEFCDTIGAQSFQALPSLERVDMSGFKNIGVKAFYEEPKLKEATFADAEQMLITTTLTDSIRSSALAFCPELVSFIAPQMEVIGMNAFATDAKLTNVVTPSVKVVQEGAFFGNSSLTHFDYFTNNERLHRIDNWAFAETGLQSVDLTGTSVSEIGNAFDYTLDLENVNLGPVTYVGDWAFADSGVRNLSMPNVTTISWGGFNGCTNLATVTAPALEDIGEEAFGNSGTETGFDISLPMIQNIQADAFWGSGVRNVTLGVQGVANQRLTIGAHAFAFTDKFESLTIFADNASNVAIDGGAFDWETGRVGEDGERHFTFRANQSVIEAYQAHASGTAAIFDVIE